VIIDFSYSADIEVGSNSSVDVFYFAQAATAFTFFLQSKKVNKEDRGYSTHLPTIALLVSQKELASLKQLSVFPSTSASGSQAALVRSKKLCTSEKRIDFTDIEFSSV